MEARARIEAVAVDGRTVYRTLRSDPPLLVRPTPIGVLLVGGAAGPLGGDRVDLEIRVGPGAELVIRSAAASLALPGPTPSRLDIVAEVAEGATLDVAPEPLVSVVGSDHRQAALVHLDPTARLRWREVAVLGRSGQVSGRLDLGLRVERGGRAILHQQLRLGSAGLAPEGDAGAGGGWAEPDDPAVLGGARVIISELVVDPQLPARPSTLGADRRALAADLAEGARLATALGGDLVEAEARLAEVTTGRPGGDPRCRCPGAGHRSAEVDQLSSIR